eukprot:gene4166-5930_t
MSNLDSIALDNYLQTIHKNINKKSEVKIFQKQYEYAQLLVSICQHKESLPYFQDALSAMSEIKTDYVWTAYYCSIAAQYAIVLDYLGELIKTESIYTDLLSLNPNGPYLGEYAVFLHRRKKEYDKAQSVYLKALDLYPEHSSIHLKYAGFLRHVRRNVKDAEVYYLKAVESNPNNAEAHGSYASFLHGVHNKRDEAEGYYEEAYRLDSSHANNLCNFGLFLSEEKKNYDRAELMYRQALDVNPKHANTLYNYAVMLDTHVKRKDEAEDLYRRTLEIEPRHAYALYNLAVLLEEKLFSTIIGDTKVAKNTPIDSNLKLEVASLYKKAVEADPRDPTTLADYGRFLLTRMEDPVKAEPILVASLKLDAGGEVALYNMALLMHRHKMNYEGSSNMLKLLLQKNPDHSSGTLQLARVLFDLYKREVTRATSMEVDLASDIYEILEESLQLYEKSINMIAEPSLVMSEFLKVVTKYANNRQKLNAIASISRMMKDRNIGLSIDELLLNSNKEQSSDPESTNIILEKLNNNLFNKK